MPRKDDQPLREPVLMLDDYTKRQVQQAANVVGVPVYVWLMAKTRPAYHVGPEVPSDAAIFYAALPSIGA